ncbi:AMP-binding protein [Actinomadura livida]|uniref:ATP-dependent acyl-CoA ligase n=1 Tax=Actinomadura livida TaxID=79909 RepID=A0A7W7IF63_9ACTN|nr:MULTISPECIES: AMP-binding protein [Actinomadura]MBB4775991.1 crotonobetaine/carnitine-CoA ligase [Actinomadura catellatispora]GGU16275.1 ATP-dependent acyl-CoA ligase [Actinomadura livida]
MKPSFEGSLPPLERRTVVHVLREQAERHPGRPAIAGPGAEIGYGALLDEAAALAGSLRAHGIRPGDRVLLMLDNHVDAILAWLGLTCAGAVEVPVNTAFAAGFLDHVVRDSGAVAAIAETHYLDRLAAADGGRLRGSVIEHVPAQSGRGRFDLPEGEPTVEDAAPWDTAAVFYTSGTTGPSKGVLVPHAQAYGYASPVYIGAVEPDDTSYVAMPLFHVGGQLWGVYNALIAGARAYISPRFTASGFWEDIVRSGSTFAVLTGAMARFLEARPPSPLERSSGLRKVCLAPVPADVDAFCARFGVAYCAGYGSTEAATPLAAPHGVSGAGGLGWVRPGFEALVVDEHDRPVPDGRIGELVVRPHEPWTMFQGYLGRPEATAEAWRNSYFHTGDAVRRTPGGEFFLVDRIRDSIRRRGENISSLEVEAAANTHPQVTETAAVGVPSEHSEDEVLLLVVPHPEGPPDPADLFRYLAERLPYFAVPRFIACTAELPRSASNKIMKGPLRAAGVPADGWDAELNGLRATRNGIVQT